MPTNINVELRTKTNADGSYNAGCYENGSPLANFVVHNGDCGAIRSLHQRVSNAYPGVAITISGPGKACIVEGIDAGAASSTANDDPINAIKRGLNALEHLRQAWREGLPRGDGGRAGVKASEIDARRPPWRDSRSR